MEASKSAPPSFAHFQPLQGEEIILSLVSIGGAPLILCVTRAIMRLMVKATGDGKVNMNLGTAIATEAIVVCEAALILVVPTVEPFAFKSLRPDRLPKLQPDDRDSVVHFSRAVVGRGKHTAGVKPPAVIASGDSDSHRTSLQPGERACRRVALAPLRDVRDGFSIVMLAVCVAATRVRVVRVAHHAVVSRPLPAVPHPATVAPIVVNRAFEALLLGECDGRSFVFDGLKRLLGQHGCKHPARAATKLALNRADFAQRGPIDRDLTQLSPIFIIIILIIETPGPTSRQFIFWYDCARPLCELLVAKIARKVVCKEDSRVIFVHLDDFGVVLAPVAHS